MLESHSAKQWAAATFELIDSLIARLKESGVLAEADVRKIRDGAVAALGKSPDAEYRGGAALLRALYAIQDNRPSNS
jgi:hypothetical protein